MSLEAFEGLLLKLVVKSV